jgi:sulfoxide reductase catalytic subunit YedY
MTRRHWPSIAPSEITPEWVYVNRRQFMKGLALGAGALALGACAAPAAPPTADPTAPPAAAAPVPAGLLPLADGAPASSGQADELGDALTPHEAVTTYNNFYEFGMDKGDPARNSKGFVSSPWTVEVGGLVNRAGTFGVEDLIRQFPPEERVYRLRCVEAWSMVIPWLGFPLAKLLQAVEPTSDAKFVRFETLLDPERMPGQRSGWYDWPYVEGLRLDEAMNDLAILSVGLYGKMLYPQNGAPIRLVVPWKYGFKSIKSIVKIDLVAEQPTSLWMKAAPNEYGFYSNVNPEVAHPRWSQATERRIGEGGRRETLPFNGYAEQVAKLYAGMDLRANY